MEDKREVKLYKIELFLPDLNNEFNGDPISLFKYLETMNNPNCLDFLKVICVDHVSYDWTDDCPLNKSNAAFDFTEEYNTVFKNNTTVK